MHRSPIPFLAALTTFSLLAPAALAAVSAADAPRATPGLLRELNSGAEVVRVIVGVKDGTPSARSLLLAPDPEGEPGRRVRRILAQKMLDAETADEEFQVRHFYESFSLIAGTATRQGAIALANRADVDWVELDRPNRLFQAGPQNAQILINSNQANALGFTGLGQTIAVLDTGADYTVSALGGGGFPNGKVIGGRDIADNDNDPMDCDGHGTEVSAVAAGPTGVAPAAKIVAIKVFSSLNPSNTSCREEASTSDILQGINYAISNKAAFGITALNMSLGEELEEQGAQGYCDAFQPAYTTAIDSATAAGIVVVAASGNSGLTNSLAAPACVSSAVSAGAVYPTAFSQVSWGGDSACTDRPVTPDKIVCFSNSNSNLSLLAPGAFWSVMTKGGSVGNFHGTSAASPSVAGAVALLWQARPDLPPAGIIGILRSTGKPITDTRNGVTTPRVDTLAAVQLPVANFAPYVGPAVGIPDGTGSAIATATVSGFDRSLATVHAWVAIDHPQPAQLKVTLSGPDGTSVVLHDQTGQSQKPINAVYGKTDASAQSLGAFQGKQANGVWTLRVEDTAVGITGRIRFFSVTMVPGQPTEAIPAEAGGRVLPFVARVQGTKFFQSDVRLYNPGASPRTFSLYLVPSGQSGATAVKATRTVGAGHVLALNDIVLSEYNYFDSFGPLTVLTGDDAFLVTSRAYTRGDNGTFGLFVPGSRGASGLSFGGGQATANGLLKNASFHTNVGFTEVSGAPVTVRMDIVSSAGVLLASTTGSVAPNAVFLITDIIAERGLPPTSNFRVDFTVISAAGRIVPFATYVDDATGDGSFQSAANPASSSEDIIVAQTSHVIGANNDFFKTNLNITNRDAQPVTVMVSLIPLLVTGVPNPPRVYTLAPGETLEKLDVLATEFNLSNPSAAGLRISPSAPARLAVSTRTFVQKFGGTFGFSIPGVLASSSIGLGATATAIQLDQTSSPDGYRSNFGFTEVGGSPVSVRVTAKSGNNGTTLASRIYSVPANTSFQANVTDVLGAGTTASNIYLQFTVESGAGRVIPYGAPIDNKSGDAIFMLAE